MITTERSTSAIFKLCTPSLGVIKKQNCMNYFKENDS